MANALSHSLLLHLLLHLLIQTQRPAIAGSSQSSSHTDHPQIPKGYHTKNPIHNPKTQTSKTPLTKNLHFCCRNQAFAVQAIHHRRIEPPLRLPRALPTPIPVLHDRNFQLSICK